jgi:flavin-dependent dehydrogenase
MHTFFFHDGIAGFGWLYPKGKDGRFANLGVAAVPIRGERIEIARHYDSFVNLLKQRGLLPAAYDAKESSGAGIHIAQTEGPVSANEETCFIIGDAAALAHRDLWNGVTSACLSGRLVAQQIVGRGVYNRSSVPPYLFDFGGRPTAFGRMVRDTLFRRVLPRLHTELERRRASPT